MTDKEYKELGHWCNLKKNKTHTSYPDFRARRDRAVALKRALLNNRQLLNKYAFVLTNCKEKESISKWSTIVDETRNDRKNLIELFNDL